MPTDHAQNASLGASATQPSVRADDAGEVSAGLRWTGHALTAVALLALSADIGFKLTQSPESVKGTMELGFPASSVLTIGILQLICFVLYVVPATAPLGAVLFTAYFGGAVATHLRLGNPLFTHILSGVYVTAILWFGLYTRDARVRALIGPRRPR